MNEKNRNDILNMRRSQLTSAAYKVVSRKGYYHFTIKDIAREAGLSTGLIHYYFKDKNDLLFHLLKEINSKIRFYLNKEMKNVTEPADKLRVYLTQAFGLAENERNYFYVLLDFLSQINHNERMKNAIKKLYQSYRDECANIIEEGISNGKFIEVDIPYVSALIVSTVQGAIIQNVLDPQAFNYKEVTEKINEQFLSMLCKPVNK